MVGYSGPMVGYSVLSRAMSSAEIKVWPPSPEVTEVMFALM